MPTWLLVVITAAASCVLSQVVRVLTLREKKIAHEIGHLFPVADDQFLRSMGGLLPPAVLGGNRITALTNGDAFYPAMLDAIASARHPLPDIYPPFASVSRAFGRIMPRRRTPVSATPTQGAFAGQWTEAVTPEMSAYERPRRPERFDLDGDRDSAHLSNPRQE